MTERDSTIGVRVTFRREGSRALVDHWSDEKTFAEHVTKIADKSCAKCAKGAGDCCMKVTLKSFSGESDEERAEAVVSSLCTAEDCPDLSLVFDPPFDAAVNARVGVASRISLGDTTHSRLKST